MEWFRRGKNLFQNIRQRREYGKFNWRRFALSGASSVCDSMEWLDKSCCMWKWKRAVCSLLQLTQTTITSRKNMCPGWVTVPLSLQTGFEYYPLLATSVGFLFSFSTRSYLVLLLASWPLLSDLHSSREIEVALCTKSFLKHPWLEHELRTIHLQVLLEESHLSICYLLLYSPKSLTPDVAMTPQTCRTQLSRRLLKLEDWPTLCWNQVESQSQQPHALESNLAKTLEWMSLKKKLQLRGEGRGLNRAEKSSEWRTLYFSLCNFFLSGKQCKKEKSKIIPSFFLNNLGGERTTYWNMMWMKTIKPKPLFDISFSVTFSCLSHRENAWLTQNGRFFLFCVCHHSVFSWITRNQRKIECQTEVWDVLSLLKSYDSLSSFFVASIEVYKNSVVRCLLKMHLPAGIAVLEMENVRRPDGVSPSTRTLYTPSRTPGIVKGKLFLCRLVSSVTGSNFPVVELYFSMLTMYSGPLGLNDGTSMETGPKIKHKGCLHAKFAQ